jgi:hypothetical protein
VRRPTKAIRAEGAETARGVETRGEAAASDIVAIVLPRRSRSALVAVWLEVEDKGILVYLVALLGFACPNIEAVMPLIQIGPYCSTREGK